MKKVGIDVRALDTQFLTGVGMYEYQLLQALIARDPQLAFTLWTSGSKVSHGTHLENLIQRAGDSRVHFGWSNRYFNLASMFGWAGSSLYKKIGADCYFFPHPNFIPLPVPKPYVVTIHDLSFKHQPSWYDVKGRLWHHGLRLNELLIAAKQIIAVSKSTAENIETFFPHVSRSKIQVIYNGVSVVHLSEAERLEVQQKFRLPESFLLYVGTLEPRKNLLSVIAAFLEVKKKHPNIALVVAGKHGWSQEQKRLRQRFQGAVIWLDYVSEKEKAALYQLTSAFVWPSFYEGFGFPPLEALAQGAPVITSYTSSMPELLGAKAWYVNPYNARELAAVIEQVLLMPKEAEIGSRVSSMYNWQSTAQQTIEILQSL
jgi:glycosyltransferase involved in cell wall biosynthesis